MEVGPDHKTNSADGKKNTGRVPTGLRRRQAKKARKQDKTHMALFYRQHRYSHIIKDNDDGGGRSVAMGIDAKQPQPMRKSPCVRRNSGGGCRARRRCM